MNLFRRLEAILGPEKEEKKIGRVIWIASNGRRGVELIGGGVVDCEGSADVGAMVWIEGDRITGSAPDLPALEIYLD